MSNVLAVAWMVTLGGLMLALVGYALYIITTMSATIVYIERNTRGILRS